ncbi:MAG: hypothetical protein ABH956_00740 [Candidatus Nealsonbacteria bacterium]
MNQEQISDYIEQMSGQKSAYICGPLTGLGWRQRKKAKRFYEDIAFFIDEITGIRSFVPHKFFDPLKNTTATSQEIDTAEREQIVIRTSVLIVITHFGPSWGGGIEVEMANRSRVPVIVICSRDQNVSRLLLGNPAVQYIIPCSNKISDFDEDTCFRLLETSLRNLDRIFEQNIFVEHKRSKISSQ